MIFSVASLSVTYFYHLIERIGERFGTPDLCATLGNGTGFWKRNKGYLVIFLCVSTSGLSTAQSEPPPLEELYENRRYQEIIDLLDKKENPTVAEEIHYARALGRLGRYSNGLVLANKIIKESIKNKDTSNLVIAYNLKTENLTDLGRVEEGLAFYKEVLPVFRKQDSVQLQLLCFKIGALYIKNKEYQKAYETYNRITINKYREFPIYLNNYGAILFELKKWDEALSFFKKTLRKKEKLKDLYLQDVTFSNIALVYMRKNRLNDAKPYLDSATSVQEKYSTLESKKGLLAAYCEFYTLKNDIPKAKEYLDSISLINDRIFDKKLNEKLEELEALNISENSLKKQVKTIDDRLNTLRQQKLYGIIVLLTLLLIFGFVIFSLRIRNVKSRGQSILAEQKLLRSQMTPHFMFNSLSIVQGMILNKENKKAASYLSKFSSLLRIVLENSREKTVALGQELTAVEQYVKLQNLETVHPFAYSVDMAKNVDQTAFQIPPMLIQPFVENAIEHAFPNKKENRIIQVHLKYLDKMLICTIADNGIGIEAQRKSSNPQKKSLATTITSERLKLLSKSFEIEGSVTVEDRKEYNEQGTIVTLVIPYKIENGQ